MEFRPPFEINPSAPSYAQQGLDRINKTVDSAGDDWQKEGDSRRRERRDQATLDLLKSKDSREADVHRYEYGDPNYSPPQPDYVSMMTGGTQGPEPAGAVDYSQGQQGPQPEGYVDHGAHLKNWLSMGKPASYDHPDYGGSGRGMGMDAYMNDAKRYGSKRMTDSQKFEEGSADTELKRSQADWYKRRYSGPPGSGRGGAGSGSITGMSTRELTTYRNSIEKDIQYAIPGTDDYNEKLDFMSQVDDELQNRVRLNRTPRGGNGAGSGSLPPAGGDDQAASLFLQQNYPQLKNPTPEDIAWAKQKMSRRKPNAQ